MINKLLCSGRKAPAMRKRPENRQCLKQAGTHEIYYSPKDIPKKREETENEF